MQCDLCYATATDGDATRCQPCTEWAAKGDPELVALLVEEIAIERMRPGFVRPSWIVEVLCPGHSEPTATFDNMVQARQWADNGHFCLSVEHHTFLMNGQEMGA